MSTATPAPRRSARLAARVARAPAPAPAPAPSPAPVRRSARLAAKPVKSYIPEGSYTARWYNSGFGEVVLEERREYFAQKRALRASAPTATPCPYWWYEVEDTAAMSCYYKPPTTSHHKLTIRIKFIDGEVATWCGDLPLTQEDGCPWDFSTRTLKNPNSFIYDVKSAQLISVETVIV
jgi:hypothetical protein